MIGQASTERQTSTSYSRDFVTKSKNVGPKIPGWLQTLQWVSRPTQFLDECRNRYGKVFELNLSGWAKHIIIAEPDLVRALLQTEPEHLETGPANELMAPLLGHDTLFLQDGPVHRSRRRLIMKNLKQENLTAAIVAGDKVVNSFIETAAARGPVDLSQLARAISMTYALTLVVGNIDLKAVIDMKTRLNNVLGNAATLMAFAKPLQQYQGPLSPWLWAERQLDELRLVLQPLINNAGSIEPNVSSVAQATKKAHIADKPISEDELYFQMLGLIVAGHDTVATAISWMFSWINTYPKVRKKTSKALSDSYAPYLCSNPPSYSEAVCLESLRLYPTIEIMSRQPVSSFHVGGYCFDQSVLLSPCAYLVHRDPEIYPNPNEFKPERFLGERPKPWEFFPFGLGNRSCIGSRFAMMQMQAVLHKLLTDWQLEPVDRRPPKPSRKHVTIHPRRAPTARITRKNVN